MTRLAMVERGRGGGVEVMWCEIDNKITLVVVFHHFWQIVRIDYARHGKLNTALLLFFLLQLSFTFVEEKITIVLAGKFL